MAAYYNILRDEDYWMLVVMQKSDRFTLMILNSMHGRVQDSRRVHECLTCMFKQPISILRQSEITK